MKKILVALLLTAVCFGCSKKETEVSVITCTSAANQSVMSKSVSVDIQYNSKNPTVLIKTETIRLTTTALQDSYTVAYDLRAKKLNSIAGVEFTYTLDGSNIVSVTTVDLAKLEQSKIAEIEWMDEAMLDGKSFTTANLRNYFILQEYSCSAYEE